MSTQPLTYTVNKNYDSPSYPDTTDVYVTNYNIYCGASDGVVSRSKPTVQTAPGPFRPYTNYSCTGTTYENSVGSTRWVYRTGAGVARRTETWDGGVTISSIGIGALPSFTATSAQRSSLLTSAMADAKEQAFDVATNLGELPEAIAMLAQTRKRLMASITETVEAYIRKNRRKPKHEILNDLVNNFSGIWLEYRYGWRPLLSSVQDLAQAVARVRIGENRVCVGMSKIVIPQAHPTLTYAQQAYAGLSQLSQYLTVQERLTTVEVRGSVALYVSPVDASFNADALATIWELIPASFLVDWTFKVGDFLRSLSLGTQAPIASSMCTSTRVVTSGRIVGTNQGFPSGKTLTSPATCRFEKFSYTRTVETGFTPTIVYKGPDLGIDEVADLLSIVKQVFFKHFR